MQSNASGLSSTNALATARVKTRSHGPRFRSCPPSRPSLTEKGNGEYRPMAHTTWRGAEIVSNCFIRHSDDFFACRVTPKGSENRGRYATVPVPHAFSRNRRIVRRFLRWQASAGELHRRRSSDSASAGHELACGVEEITLCEIVIRSLERLRLLRGLIAFQSWFPASIVPG